MSNPKAKRVRVCTQIDPELAERIKRACEFQKHTEAQLVQILLEWALPYYEKVRSVEVLRRQPRTSKTSKR